MNTNNAVALEPSSMGVRHAATNALLTLLLVKNGKVLGEKEIEHLRRAEELLKIIVNLSRLDEGKTHEVGETAGIPVEFLWLKEPAEAVGNALHTADTPLDHGSHFLEHLSFKLATIIGQLERGTDATNGETALLERFFASLSNRVLGMANKKREKEGNNDGD